MQNTFKNRSNPWPQLSPRSRVTSVHSWYLTSFVILAFLVYPLLTSLTFLNTISIFSTEIPFVPAHYLWSQKANLLFWLSLRLQSLASELFTLFLCVLSSYSFSYPFGSGWALKFLSVKVRGLVFHWTVPPLSVSIFYHIFDSFAIGKL